MKTLIALALSSLFFVSGCRTITYESIPDGRKVTYCVFGLDTSLGGLEIGTPQGGKIVVKDHTSDASNALGVASKALDKIPVPTTTATPPAQ